MIFLTYITSCARKPTVDSGGELDGLCTRHLHPGERVRCRRCDRYVRAVKGAARGCRDLIASGDTGTGRRKERGEITVRIGVLGTLQVDDGDGGAVRVGGHRARALLILLALDAGRVVPPHKLIERLWPDDRPRTRPTPCSP